MSEVTTGDTVRVHYTGTLEDGSQFDSSMGRDPLEVTIGTGQVIAGFEQALVGMAVGETKTVTLPADDAYGQHDARKVQDVDRAKIPDDVPLEVGRVIEAVGESGHTLSLRVVAMNEEVVTFDFNHPLAGFDLTFQVQLVEIL